MIPTPSPAVALLPLQDKAVAVAGLLWRPLPPKSSQQTKRLLLENSGGEYLVLHRNHRQEQYGIAPRLPNDQQYYSAALLLMAQLGDDWVGIFEWQPGEYLLFGVAAGQIVPGCDGLFDSVEAVTAQFERYQALCDWSIHYAPAHLNLGGKAIAITTLLNPSTPLAYPLQAINNSQKNRKRLLLGGGLLCLLIILSLLGWRHRAKQAELLQLTQQQLLQAQQQYQKNKKESLEAVWRQQPAASRVLQQCGEHLSQYPLLLGGWQLVEAQCTPKKSSAHYRRVVPHQTQDFIQAAAIHYPNCSQLQSAELAQIQQPLRLEARGEEQLQPLSTLFNHWMNFLERGVISGRIDDCLAASTAAKKRAQFELSGQPSPLQLFHTTKLDGVVIQQINATLSPNGNVTWTTRGEFYGQ